VPERPYTILSCGISLDGYLDSASHIRLLLSNEADLDRVDSVRAQSDAILVGAATVRNDNPRLLVQSQERRDERVRQGRSPLPAKVTVTRTGDLDPCANFFTLGDTTRIVYCASPALPRAREQFEPVATVVDAGPQADMRWVSEDLFARGIKQLMVEGGGTLHTQFLTADLADELHVVIAPFFVGDSNGKRFVGDGEYPWNAGRRATLVESRPIGDVVLLRYALSDRFCAR
jgi:5-amino-6-(5-phosphoribosylamino)uracil reductase